jgi:hypothetical protein
MGGFLNGNGDDTLQVIEGIGANFSLAHFLVLSIRKAPCPMGNIELLNIETSKRPRPVRGGMAACSLEHIYFARTNAVFATSTRS